MKTVAWRFMKYKADAEEAYQEMQQLEKITPENVVSIAEDESSVLHDDFEWDNEIAGYRYRLEQARQMITDLIVIDNSKPEPEPTKMRVFHISTEKHTYKPIRFFIENKTEYEILLERALRELKAFKEKYSNISELEQVFIAIDNL